MSLKDEFVPPGSKGKKNAVETALHGIRKQKREATLLLAPLFEAFALPCQSNEQRDLTPYAYNRSAFHDGTHGYNIPMSIIVAWF